MINSRSDFQLVVEQIGRTNRSDNLSYIRSSLENSHEFRDVAAPTKFKDGSPVAAEPLPGSGSIMKGRWEGKTEFDSYIALDSLGRAIQWWQFWK